jgi:hypothetical protein
MPYCWKVLGFVVEIVAEALPLVSTKALAVQLPPVHPGAAGVASSDSAGVYVAAEVPAPKKKPAPSWPARSTVAHTLFALKATLEPTVSAAPETLKEPVTASGADGLVCTVTALGAGGNPPW